MDFFARQDQARRHTGMLIVYFSAAVLLIIVSVNLVAVGVANAISAYQTVKDQIAGVPYSPRTGLWQPDVIACATIATLAVIVGGSMYKIAQLSRGGRAVAELLGATPVLSNTDDPRFKTLRDVVEEMSIASGVAVPAIYVMTKEPGINAFAAGLTQQDAVICVTRGCLEKLSREQLQGVVAHEFSHILNGDIRLNLKLVGALFGILVVGLIGYGMIRGAFATGGDDDSDWRAMTVLSVIGAALMVIGFVGVFFGRLIQAGVCRQREFLADASAVQFTRQPGGLAGALKLIGARNSVSRVIDSDSEQIAHMFFASSMGQSRSWMATHPPIEKRILALDSAWDGKFPAAPETACRYISPAGVPLNAKGIAQSIGAPTPRHVKWASDYLSAIPPAISQAARDPFAARALVFAVLLSDEPDVRNKQIQLLGPAADAPTVQATVKLLGPVAQIGSQGRRVLVDLALPALGQLSGPQCEQFGRAVNALIDADGRVTVFEYMLTRILAKNVTARKPPSRPQVAYYAIKPLVPYIQTLLSALADADGKDEAAIRAAFDAGVGPLQLDDSLSLTSSPGIAAIDAALDRLSLASPAIKRCIVEGCAACVAADGIVQTEEAELLRAVTTALDCPLPPILAGNAVAVQSA
jgi:Zn-dependent protease with chaperone function